MTPERKAAINKVLSHITGMDGDFTREIELLDRALLHIIQQPWNYKKMRYQSTFSAKGWKLLLQGRYITCANDDTTFTGPALAEMLATAVLYVRAGLQEDRNSHVRYLNNPHTTCAETRRKYEGHIQMLDLWLDTHAMMVKQIGISELPD